MRRKTTYRRPSQTGGVVRLEAGRAVGGKYKLEETVFFMERSFLGS